VLYLGAWPHQAVVDSTGYDYVGAVYSGVLDMTGFADRSPVFPQLGLGDVSTGVHALNAILAALL
jgi:crotonobetainyl-CoA:carnitine CoA-transferase CaiB-like acyl-CoA transferase